MDHPESFLKGFGSFVSYIIGWVYFIAWSASFYPQAILNYRRKSVQGLSMDFIYLNVIGFLCYSIFNLAFFFSSDIQEEYRHRNDGQENLVRANDVFFALHALILSTFTLVQTWVYKSDPNQRVSLLARIFIFVSILVTSYLVGQVLWGKTKEWIDILYFLSYVKLVISFVKYCPQVYINWVAKSTVGWSIHNILLDFTGGTLSISQLVLDAYISGDWSGISGDPVKFGLGFLSIAFDLVFMTQHYILYRDRTDRYVSSDKNHEGGEAGGRNSSSSDSTTSQDERQGLLSKVDTKRYSAQGTNNDLESGAVADSIEEAKKARQEEWKKAHDNKENPPPLQEEVPYDPRTLYERLQEQKQKKDDAFAEATKFGNLIHRIDNDEFDFLNTLENDEAKKKRELAEQEEEELKRFRMNVQIKSAPPPPQPAGLGSFAAPPTSSSSAPSAAKKKKSLFAGLVKRIDDDSKGSSSTSSPSSSSKTPPSTKESPAIGGKRKAETQSPTLLEHVNNNSSENKKPKMDNNTPVAKPKSNALLSLVAYDSDSGEDD
ncbi:hypothetical protein BGX27_003029 [Mortierella sp. AM989]|nr:hypothetical protein BGX27_003029 [Mortierella sp. AM989]